MITLIIATALAAVSPCEDGATFSSLESAVDILGTCYHRKSQKNDKEYITSIVEQDGVYTIHTADDHTTGNPSTIKIHREKGQTLVALWHTHGKDRTGRDAFTVGDVDLAYKLQVPIYLVRPQGELYIFTQGMAVNGPFVRIKSSFLKYPKGSARGKRIGNTRY